MISAKLQNRILVAFFALYACVTLYTVVHHEPGRDETAPWLVVRDTAFLDIFRELHYQLHPFLWYLIMFPFAKLGLPCFTIAILNWLMAAGIVYLLLWRSPFPKLTGVLAAFSFYLFWAYSIEARGVYALGFLLLFIIAVNYKSRFSHPLRYGILLFLLANTNAFMVPTAAGLVFIWFAEAWFDKKLSPKLFCAMGIVALGGLFAAWELGAIFPLSDLPALGRTDNVGFQISALPKAIVGAFFTGINPVPFLFVPALVILAFLLRPFLSRPYSGTFCVIHILGNLAAIGIKPVYLCERHYGIILMGIVFALWIAHYEKDLIPKKRAFDASFAARFAAASIALNISFLSSTGLGMMMSYYDWNYLYSGCSQMAAFIKNNNLERFPIASQRYGHLTPVAAFLPGKKFWYAGIAKDATFVHQDATHMNVGHVMPYEQALKKIDEHFPPSEEILILLDVELKNTAGSKYKLLHKVDKEVFGSDERCYLYLRTPQTADPQIRLFQ